MPIISLSKAALRRHRHVGVDGRASVARPSSTTDIVLLASIGGDCCNVAVQSGQGEKATAYDAESYFRETPIRGLGLGIGPVNVVRELYVYNESTDTAN